MNWTLHQLTIFNELTRTLSVSRTAENLHLTQPAVSIQLRNFQAQFEQPLFELVGRKIHITPFGQQLAEQGQLILDGVTNINQLADAYQGRIVGELRIASVSTGKYVIPFFLTDFVAANPAIELKIDITNKAQVIDALKSNAVDFALVSVMPTAPLLNSIELLDNKLHLIGNSVMAARYSNSPSDEILREAPLIFREVGSGTRQVMEVHLRENNLAVKKTLELTSNEAVKQAVIAGLGLSIMPLIGLRKELETGELKIIPINGFPIHSTWRLVWRTEKKLSSAALAYMSYIKMHNAHIRIKHFGWHNHTH